MHFLSVKCTIFCNSLTLFNCPLGIFHSFFRGKPQFLASCFKKGKELKLMPLSFPWIQTGQISMQKGKESSLTENTVIKI